MLGFLQAVAKCSPRFRSPACRNVCQIFTMETPLKLGTRVSYYANGPVRLFLHDRRRHMLVSGRSGTGKSTLLANIFAQEANCGRGLILIDPHGDLAQAALDLVPPRRIRKTIYINPADSQWPVGFNVLAGVPVASRPARAADIIAAFKAIWADSWGPRLEHILYNTVAALLDTPDATLISIPLMLTEAKYRQQVIQHIVDPMVARFWKTEFPLLEKKFGAEATSPILNKVGQLLASPEVRNIIAQQKSGFDVRHVMDNNYIVIANLSKGLLGEHHANLIGALLISAFGSAALSRADTPENDRKDFLMIIDEFQNYTTKAFSTLLAEARKYRLSLVLAHQYLDQIQADVKAAVLGNAGSIFAFRIGSQDTPTFTRELDPVSATQLTETPNYEAWCRILQNGQPSDVFRLSAPPPPKPHGHGHKIVKNSRIHFATSREKIEARITKFLSNTLGTSVKLNNKPAPPDW